MAPEESLGEKDAAVVVALAALGKARPRPYTARSAWEQELAACRDWLVAQRWIAMLVLGRLRALLARHWPEGTRLLPVSSATLLRALAHYGDPAAVAADGKAAKQVQRWGRQRLRAETVRGSHSRRGSCLPGRGAGGRCARRGGDARQCVGSCPRDSGYPLKVPFK